MHVFLTGKPACGKTTLIKELLKYIKNCRGFFTEEIRENNQRVGFKVITLIGNEAIFAHKDFNFPYSVGKYKIDIDSFNKIAIRELKEALEENCEIVVIDEIGKMEVLSQEFKKICLEILDKRRVLGTISIIEEPFIRTIKGRKDVCILEVTKENFLQIKEKVLLAINSLPVEKIRLLESAAYKLGFEERILIENASSSLTEEIEKLNLGKNILVIAGKGNNGADVLSSARKLLVRGYNTKIAIVTDGQLNKEVLFQKSILEKINAPLYIIDESKMKELERLISDADCVIDGLLGIGINKEVCGITKETIKLINKFSKKVIACDIPSGLEPNEGIVLGEAIEADFTITFLAPKDGFFLGEGRKFCGKIIVKDIGISKEILEKHID
ncbi:MAG: NAD(P)H-hydrate epimerase [Candidatus Omnitrophica bacterium]|nr:NAD(P)H-hydrate epimerase [Candidatus Omnitrophota bacterium]